MRKYDIAAAHAVTAANRQAAREEEAAAEKKKEAEAVSAARKGVKLKKATEAAKLLAASGPQPVEKFKGKKSKGKGEEAASGPHHVKPRTRKFKLPAGSAAEEQVKGILPFMCRMALPCSNDKGAGHNVDALTREH